MYLVAIKPDQNAIFSHNCQYVYTPLYLKEYLYETIDDDIDIVCGMDKYRPVRLSLNKWSCIVFSSNTTSLTPTCQYTATGKRKRAQQWTWRWRNRSMRHPARRRKILTPPRSQRMGRVLVRSRILGLSIRGRNCFIFRICLNMFLSCFEVTPPTQL